MGDETVGGEVMRMGDDELRALLAKVTPGEWTVCKYDAGDRSYYDHNGPCPSIQSEDSDCAVVHWDGFKQKYYSSANGHQGQIEANASLIAAAPNLAAEVLELRAEVARLRGLEADTYAASKAVHDDLQSTLTAERENADRLAGSLEDCMKVLPEPDRRICCSGAWEHCGCMGATVHQEAEHYACEAIAAHMKMRGK